MSSFVSETLVVELSVSGFADVDAGVDIVRGKKIHEGVTNTLVNKNK